MLRPRGAIVTPEECCDLFLPTDLGERQQEVPDQRCRVEGIRAVEGDIDRQRPPDQPKLIVVRWTSDDTPPELRLAKLTWVHLVGRMHGTKVSYWLIYLA